MPRVPQLESAKFMTSNFANLNRESPHCCDVLVLCYIHYMLHFAL